MHITLQEIEISGVDVAPGETLWVHLHTVPEEGSGDCGVALTPPNPRAPMNLHATLIPHFHVRGKTSYNFLDDNAYLPAGALEFSCF